MKTKNIALLALAAGLAVASSAALAAPRVVGGPNPTPAQPSSPAKKAIDEAKKKDTEKLNKGVNGIGKGDTEFGFSLLYDNYEDSDTNELFLTASVGQFISDRSEIIIQPQIIYVDSGGSTTFGILPFFGYKYMFRGASLGNPVVPYVGAGIGIDLYSIDTGGPTGSIFQYGINVAPIAGLKAFVTERASLEYQASYRVGIAESCDDYDCYSQTTNGFNNLLLFNIYY